MNSKLENAIHTGFVSALLVSVLMVGTAFAGTPGDVRSETVKFQDLNLQSNQGIQSLYQRIEAAARRVCEQPDGMSSPHSIKACEEQAESSAVTSVNVPALTAYYQSKSGHAAPVLARAE
jgi:UrcA family protein